MWDESEINMWDESEIKSLCDKLLLLIILHESYNIETINGETVVWFSSRVVQQYILWLAQSQSHRK